MNKIGSKQKTIVIGAGIAGLTAAHTLSKAGIAVKVLEASGRIGGRMRTDVVNGFVVDCGAQFLSSEYGLLLSIIREMELESAIRHTSRWSAIVRDGKLSRIRVDNPLDALTSGLLSLTEWLKLGWRTWHMRNPLTALPLNDYSRWAAFDTETAAAWTNRNVGSAITEYIVEPMLQGFYFQEPEDTSLALSLILSAFGFRRSRTLTIESGMGRLPEMLASRLDVTLNSPVISLQLGKDSVTVVTNQSRFEADYVVLAVPATEARRIFIDVDELEQRLMATRYSANINIAVMTDDRFHLPESLTAVYGLLIPRRERACIAAIGIESNKSRDRAPRGQLFNIMLSGANSEAMLSLPDDAVLKVVMPEAEKYLPELSKHITSTVFYRWTQAEPYSHVGRSMDLRIYRDRLHLSNKRVLLAGDYMNTPYTEGAAESGQWAANQICHTTCNMDFLQRAPQSSCSRTGTPNGFNSKWSPDAELYCSALSSGNPHF
jgi:oxygen-dependent protoporphyrinogen oxidase